MVFFLANNKIKMPVTTKVWPASFFAMVIPRRARVVRDTPPDIGKNGRLDHPYPGPCLLLTLLIEVALKDP